MCQGPEDLSDSCAIKATALSVAALPVQTHLVITGSKVQTHLVEDEKFEEGLNFEEDSNVLPDDS